MKCPPGGEAVTDQKRRSGDPLSALRRNFGNGIATMVAGLMELDHLGRPAAQHADAAVPAAGKQQRKAREVLDIYLPVAHQLSMPAVRTELQALAFATLIRNRPAGRPGAGPSSGWTSSSPPAAPSR
jgi:(p)ppGpp synthase/HD superfamily hydrolase